MRFAVQKWLANPADFHDTYNKSIPVPMRTMFGEIVKTSKSGKMVHVKLYGKPEPSDTCLHCNRPLTHEISMHYGIGPICGGHFYIKPYNNEDYYEYIKTVREQLSQVTWEGWLPLNGVTIANEVFYTIVFTYGDTPYRVTTSDLTKVDEIRRNAHSIISEDISEG